MRIVRVWLYALGFMFVITFTWYITTPLIFTIGRYVRNYAEENLAAIPEVFLLIDVVLTIASLWGAFLDFFIFIWALLESQRRDVESEIYS